MALLSIDVGIKNLAYCLLDEHTIYNWGVVNLIEDKKFMCCFETKTGVCKNEAKFTKNSKYFCLKHAKREDFMVPNPEINTSNIKKLDIIKLKALCIKCKKNEALFTHRLTNEKEQTVVGGSESYCALCRSCYNSSFYDGVEIV